MDIRQAMQAVASCDLVEMETKLPGQTEPVYYRPATLAHADRLKARFARLGENATDGEQLVETIIVGVLDADGNPVFTDKDRAFLREKVPQQYLADMVLEMAEPPTIEAAEGN